MEKIIDDYFIEMKKLINYLGKENIIISIMENGDSTDKTREKLYEFMEYLNETEIVNRIIIDKRSVSADMRSVYSLLRSVAHYMRSVS